MLRLTASAPREAIRVVGLTQSYHPIRDYLNDLRWDGVDRLPTFLAQYFGARTEAPEYLAKIGSLALIAADARAMQPGCKYDYVIIVEGPQGKGKSAARAQALLLTGSMNTRRQSIASSGRPRLARRRRPSVSVLPFSCRSTTSSI